MLSLHLPVTCGRSNGASAAGAGSAIFSTYFATVQRQRVPAEALARVTAFDLTGAYALGSIGFVVIGRWRPDCCRTGRLRWDSPLHTRP
jgi:hypothetical protein